jgi:Domain of unknown function (DUF4833)
MRRPPLTICLLVGAAMGALSPVARRADADPLAALTQPVAGARMVRSVFFVSKSENRNEVHYGIDLDASCAPVGAAPVFAYWQMREHGPLATEPLLSREIPAYGLASQRVLERHASGGRVVLTLNALPHRAIAIDTASEGGSCTATAVATIDGAPAALTNVFVQLRWPFGVDYLLVSGRATADGHVVRERLPAR